jgi:flagellar hook assembly protein FlgD
VALVPSAPTIDLKIDHNNPLKPARRSRLVAASFDRDRNLRMRVFSMSGELVMDWPEFIVPKDAYYVIEWDGSDINGVRLKRGIYIVNLYDANDKSRSNKRIAILDR